MADINGIDVRIASEIPDQEAEEFLNIIRRHLRNKNTRCESEDKGNPPRINECEYCMNGKNLNCQYDSYAKIIPVGGTHKYFSVYLLEFDNSDCIARKDVGIKFYNGTEPVFTEKDGYVAVNTNAFFMDFGKGD